jgi:IMP and pyridine-specific 5'-nucleotidase
MPAAPAAADRAHVAPTLAAAAHPAAAAAAAAEPASAPPPPSHGPTTTTEWADLLNTPEPDGSPDGAGLGGASSVLGPRARSASDAGVLRRKGHLKEQDPLIEFMLAMHATHTADEVAAKFEAWVADHRADPHRSRLRRMIPGVGAFFTPLPLTKALAEYDEFFALSRRKYVPPNFAELRHVLNIAQVHASARAGLRLITFDADGTLYADGAHMRHDSDMIAHIVRLLRAGVHVAIVTAAGYPGDAARFEARLPGLLSAFAALDLPAAVTDRFHIMGGECNYLLRVVPPDEQDEDGGASSDEDGGGGGGGGGAGAGAAGGSRRRRPRRLAFVDDAEWKSPEMRAWRERDVASLLDAAQAVLAETAHRLRVPVSIVRKERAVGVVPTAPTVYEVLEEMAITVQVELSAAAESSSKDGGGHVAPAAIPALPFCAFNGGGDVFVDVGNKSLGLEALKTFLGLTPAAVLHVGDRFTSSGNDAATRDCCSILWVANPEETDFFIRLLLADLEDLSQAEVE